MLSPVTIKKIKYLQSLSIEELAQVSRRKISKGKSKGCATDEALLAQRIIHELSGRLFRGGFHRRQSHFSVCASF